MKQAVCVLYSADGSWMDDQFQLIVPCFKAFNKRFLRFFKSIQVNAQYNLNTVHASDFVFNNYLSFYDYTLNISATISVDSNNHNNKFCTNHSKIPRDFSLQKSKKLLKWYFNTAGMDFFRSSLLGLHTGEFSKRVRMISDNYTHHLSIPLDTNS